MYVRMSAMKYIVYKYICNNNNHFYAHKICNYWLKNTGNYNILKYYYNLKY